jgi:hypothetical protein
METKESWMKKVSFDFHQIISTNASDAFASTFSFVYRVGRCQLLSNPKIFAHNVANAFGVAAIHATMFTNLRFDCLDQF